MPDNTILRGNVNIGDGTTIEDNVVLGNKDDGTVTIGENSIVRSGTVIYSGVTIGKNFKTGHNVLIREETQIGDNVLVGTNSVVDGHCTIGNSVSIQTSVYVTAYTTIEDDAFMGPRSVTTNDKYMEIGAELVGPTIKKGARIGANATLLPGVTIGEGAVIGSGAVVTKDMAPAITAIGNPARKMNQGSGVRGQGARSGGSQGQEGIHTFNRSQDGNEWEDSQIVKDKRIAVIGMGYVGIPAAALLANAGYDVTGIQRRSQRSGWKIDWLNEGKCPIGGNEPELPEILQTVVQQGRFRVTDDYSVLKNIDIILIDVQTPTDSDHIPQYKSLKEVSHQVGKYLSPGKLVIVESTVAPGTTENMVQPILEEESGLRAGLPDGFGLSFSYERVMVGRLIHNIREYPKIVGGIDDKSREIAMEMYRSIVRAGVHGTNPMTAEVSKTVENAYRDVQIAFANEVALLCESLGIDVHEVREFVNGLPNDPSAPHANPIRNMHFPGAGVGGHCLPKDTWLLMHGYEKYAESQNDYSPSILTGARYLNDWMPIHMVNLLEEALREESKEINGSMICVLGYAFLENSDDPRNTPTIPLIKELERRGATCRVHDPFIAEDEGYQIEQDVERALTGCDAVVLMTKHDQYNAITPEKLKSLLSTRIIVDGRNILDPREFLAEGFVFKGIGKGNINKRRNGNEPAKTFELHANPLQRSKGTD
ncbi:MAG: nucleotide sugar dehydrogenase [Chloroflexi bacterium]|nr:nucleotide sugar dehydrogenase [Chloroflexota bacterium]